VQHGAGHISYTKLDYGLVHGNFTSKNWRIQNVREKKEQEESKTEPLVKVPEA